VAAARVRGREVEPHEQAAALRLASLAWDAVRRGELWMWATAPPA